MEKGQLTSDISHQANISWNKNLLFLLLLLVTSLRGDVKCVCVWGGGVGGAKTNRSWNNQFSYHKDRYLCVNWTDLWNISDKIGQQSDHIGQKSDSFIKIWEFDKKCVWVYLDNLISKTDGKIYVIKKLSI